MGTRDKSVKDGMKEKLILNKLEKIYCKLAPSKIHGIGVFAIKTIPKGTNPFKDSYMAQDSILIKKSKIGCEKIKSLLNDYHPNSTEGDEYQIVSQYPNQLLWTNYINYSDTPNVILRENGEWETVVEIKEGEEILENPKEFFDANGNRKIFHVKVNQYPFLGYV